MEVQPHSLAARSGIMRQPNDPNTVSNPRPTTRHRGTMQQHCGSRRWRGSSLVLRASDEFTNEGKPIASMLLSSKNLDLVLSTRGVFLRLGDGHAEPDLRGPRVRARARGGAAGRGRGPARRKIHHSERAGGAARAVPEARGEATTGARLSFFASNPGCDHCDFIVLETEAFISKPEELLLASCDLEYS